jgi:hypothetical protein
MKAETLFKLTEKVALRALDIAKKEKKSLSESIARAMKDIDIKRTVEQYKAFKDDDYYEKVIEKNAFNFALAIF